MRPAALRAAGRLLRLYQRSGLEALARRIGLTRLLPAGSAPARAAGAGDRARDSRTADRAPARRRPAPSALRVALLTGCVQDLVFPDINRDTADVLLANGCEVDTPRIAAVLRLAARAQRRAGAGADAGAAADRSDPAGSLRRDHHERRRLRLASAALRSAARRRPGLPRAGAAVGPQAARHPGVARGGRLPARPTRVAVRRPDRR